MRIIAGSAKGRPIKVPQRRATRPATELVRGAIFGMLENMAADWSVVLDIYSGSGSLGIEALSRGAGTVDFVEQEPACCAIIKQNLAGAGFSGQAHVYCTNVSGAIAFLDKEYGIILADPPYTFQGIGGVLEKLVGSRLVTAEETVLVVTHSSRFNLAPGYGDFRMVKERRHGDSVVAIYMKASIA